MRMMARAGSPLWLPFAPRFSRVTCDCSILTEVQAEVFEADRPEPMPGIGPMSASLEAFAEFFGIDSDLVQAAAERSAVAMASTLSPEAVRGIISAMTDTDKTAMLSRL